MPRVWNVTNKPLELEQGGVVCARWPVAGRVATDHDEREAGELAIGNLRIPVVKRGASLCTLRGIEEDEILPGDVVLADEHHVEVLRRHFGGRTRVMQVVGRTVGDATRIEKLLA